MAGGEEAGQGAVADAEPTFRDYYGPTMNAYAAARADGREEELHAELTDLFEAQNTAGAGATRVPATYLRVVVQV